MNAKKRLQRAEFYAQLRRANAFFGCETAPGTEFQKKMDATIGEWNGTRPETSGKREALAEHEAWHKRKLDREAVEEQNRRLLREKHTPPMEDGE
jgi:hypothetical protein